MMALDYAPRAIRARRRRAVAAAGPVLRQWLRLRAALFWRQRRAAIVRQARAAAAGVVAAAYLALLLCIANAPAL